MAELGLVLEGGGMRVAYTAGVVDALYEKNIDFNYIIGVSAGATLGANIVSNQRFRNREIFAEEQNSKKSVSMRQFLMGEGYLDMDYIYHEIPSKLNPFDYKEFRNSDKVFKVCVTNCETGEAEYIEKSEYEDEDLSYIDHILEASSSLPIITLPKKLKDTYYYDGGIVDSIPIKKSMADGNVYNVVILTRTKDYRKKKQVLGPFRRSVGRKFPRILDKVDRRHDMYNYTVEEIIKLEEEGRVFVFRPIENFEVARLEKDSSKLLDLYKQGYEETKNRLDEFYKWIENIK